MLETSNIGKVRTKDENASESRNKKYNPRNRLSRRWWKFGVWFRKYHRRIVSMLGLANSYWPVRFNAKTDRYMHVLVSIVLSSSLRESCQSPV
jgi:hypothetical protein